MTRCLQSHAGGNDAAPFVRKAITWSKAIVYLTMICLSGLVLSACNGGSSNTQPTSNTQPKSTTSPVAVASAAPGTFPAFSPSQSPYSLTADKLPNLVGDTVGTEKVARDGKTQQGYLIYGPYLTLPPGEYEIALDYTSSDSVQATWDVIFDLASVVLSEGSLPPAKTNGGTFKTKFKVGADGRELSNKPFEFRVLYGTGDLTVKKMTLTYLAQNRS